jgi:hypothetical protein
VLAFLQAGIQKDAELTSSTQVLDVLKKQAAEFPPDLVKVSNSILQVPKHLD